MKYIVVIEGADLSVAEVDGPHSSRIVAKLTQGTWDERRKKAEEFVMMLNAGQAAIEEHNVRGMPPIHELLELAEFGWTVIANVGVHGEGWKTQHEDWVTAAEKYREGFHKALADYRRFMPDRYQKMHQNPERNQDAGGVPFDP